MRGFDAWLTRDWREDESELFENWCELTGTDPNAVGAWETFEDEQEARREDAMIAAYESRQDMERDDDRW